MNTIEFSEYTGKNSTEEPSNPCGTAGPERVLGRGCNDSISSHTIYVGIGRSSFFYSTFFFGDLAYSPGVAGWLGEDILHNGNSTVQ